MTPRHALIIPGLDGDPSLLKATAPSLLPGWHPLFFNHQEDDAQEGLTGLVDRAQRFLDAHVPAEEAVLVVGESFGGPLAITLAERIPSRVVGLLLLSTFARYPDAARPACEMLLRTTGMLRDHHLAPFLRLAHTVGVVGQVGLRAPRHMQRTYFAQPLPSGQTYREKSRLALSLDVRASFASLRMPVCIVFGTADPIVPPSASLEMAQLQPQAHVVALPGGLHLAHIRRAHEVGKQISAWCAACVDVAGAGGERVNAR